MQMLHGDTKATRSKHHAGRTNPPKMTQRKEVVSFQSSRSVSVAYKFEETLGR